MSNSNSQLDGLGSFNHSAKNAGTIKYGAFLNAAQNLGSIALTATFGGTSQNLGTIGDIIPIITASIVQSNSANWDAAYTAVVSNSAIWELSGGSGSGDATNAPIWDAVAAYVQAASSTFLTLQDGSAIKWDEVSSYVQSNSGSFVLSNDNRLNYSVNGQEAYTYLNSNSANLISEGDSRLTDNRNPTSHTHHASAITAGVFDIDRIPVIPTLIMIVIDGIMYDNNAFASIDENTVIDGFTYVLSSIEEGTVIALNDGYRYVYKGSGGKRFASSYIQLADITPHWNTISNKPSVFTPDVHTHTMADITDINSQTHVMSSITDLRDSFWDTAYSYVNSNSANIVMTSDSRLARASTAFSYVIANSANNNTVYSTVTANSASWSIGTSGSINYTIDGGGNAITTGSKGFIQIPTNFVVQEWIIFADLLTTSLIIDVRKASYANLPTTTTIVNSDLLTLTNQQKNRNTSVSWTNISAGDFVEFFVTDASNASIVNISLKGVRS
jgi:hypothetical protein